MLLQTFLWQRTGQNQLSEYAGLTERHMMKINHTQISINSDVFGDDALLREKLSPLFAGIQKFNKKKNLNGKEYELQLETVRDGKLFVNPLHLPVEGIRLSALK